MIRATLILMLFASCPLLAVAADPAPAQADFEPKPLQATETRAKPDPQTLPGPEDFVLPVPTSAPITGKDTDTLAPAPERQVPTNAQILDGF